jgi:molybdopterin-biosynthesis enzyme MoeA-like protein
MTTAEIITIGTELLPGETANLDTRFNLLLRHTAREAG